MKRTYEYATAIVLVAIALISLVPFIPTHCATEIVVVDETGQPLAAAKVEPMSLSIAYDKIITDADGSARLPLVVQPIHFIGVTKNGYKPYRSGNISQVKRKRIVVILKEEPAR